MMGCGGNQILQHGADRGDSRYTKLRLSAAFESKTPTYPLCGTVGFYYYASIMLLPMCNAALAAQVDLRRGCTA